MALQQTPALPSGRYHHYKGKDYEVFGLVRHSETQEELVIYRCLYGDFSCWAWPLAMFNEDVVYEGAVVPRFVYAGPMADDTL